MKRRISRVIGAGIAIAAVMILFPPWLYVKQYTSSEEEGSYIEILDRQYAPLFTPPAFPRTGGQIQLDFESLFMQLGFLLIAEMAAVFSIQEVLQQKQSRQHWRQIWQHIDMTTSDLLLRASSIPSDSSNTLVRPSLAQIETQSEILLRPGKQEE